MSIPGLEALRPAVRAAYELARDGKNIAIHCHAGVGRTGMFAACLASEALGLTGEQAISWVRERILNAVENLEQRDVVLNFQPESE